MEGNELSNVTMGATTARIQASVLSLYDSTRLKNPIVDGQPTTIEESDKVVQAALAGLNGGKLAIVTPSLMSPSTKLLVEGVIEKYGNAVHVNYDSLSASGMIEANQACFDKAALASYAFHKADVIVSVAADFLGEWYNAGEISKQYAKGRNCLGVLEVYTASDKLTRNFGLATSKSCSNTEGVVVRNGFEGTAPRLRIMFNGGAAESHSIMLPSSAPQPANGFDS